MYMVGHIAGAGGGGGGVSVPQFRYITLSMICTDITK